MTAATETQKPLSKWQTELDSYIFSGYQILYIQTSEEGRVENDIHDVCTRNNMRFVTWDVVQGFTGDIQGLGFASDEQMVDPKRALNAVAAGVNKSNTVYVFRDLDDFYASNNVTRRQLQNIAEHGLLNRVEDEPIYQVLIILSAASNIPPKLAPHVSPLEFSLPDDDDILKIIDFILVSSGETMEESLKEQLVRCLAGLTSNEAENCFARALRLARGPNAGMLPIVKAEKAKIVKKSDILTYIPEESVGTAEHIGGYEALYEWIEKRKSCYSKAAIAAGLDFPKGIGLCGVPGVGKSVVAKILCKMLNLPGYTMNIGAVFGSLVGESEQRIRDAIKQIEAQKGCVLVLDEIDKALGGMATGSGDSGVGKRVFGTLLTWLAEKTSPTFVVATLNRIDDLPPELTRAGRFDAIFCVDIPDKAARENIFRIHLSKRNRQESILELDTNGWGELLDATDQFVGAEIEAVVIDAQCASFTNRGTASPNIAELLASAKTTIPMSKLQSKELEAMRELQTSGKARPVSKTPVVEPKARKSRVVNMNTLN